MKKHGFWGEVEVTDPQTGEVRTTNVTPWRLRTIYRTNMQSAYMAGRYQAQTEDDNRPYLQYVALMDAKTRDSHAELHGTVLHKDDPFWDENYPPNGWGCRCRVRARSKRDVERRGLKVLDRGKARPVAEKGFKSNPGKAARHDFAHLEMNDMPKQATWRDFGLTDARNVEDAMRLKAPLLTQAKTVSEAHRVLAEVFGVNETKKTAFIQTPSERVAVFYDSLRHMVEKRGDARERFGNMARLTLEQPFEIWLTRFKDGNRETYRKQYIGLFKSGKDDILVSVVPQKDGGLFYNFMQRTDKDINKRRRGDMLLYRKQKTTP